MRKACALLFVLLAAGCATNPPAETAGTKAVRPELVGEWRYADATQSCQYAFAGDGTFHGTVALNGEKISQFSGRWSASGNTLSYEYINDALGRIPPGSIDHDKLLKVSAEWFEIEAADGSRRIYRRVR